MMLHLDAVVAGQSRCCLLHDIVLVRVRAAGPHAPYLPCWLLPVQRPAVVSICFVDFETIFSLVFRWDEVMLLNQPVPMNSGTWAHKKKTIGEFPEKNGSAISENYLFKSNVDSNWKTCAREKTVRVFFFRFDCMEPFAFGDPLSDGRSGLSGPSSSIISCPSSSESFDVFMYDEWSWGECFAADVSGLTDGEAFSVVFVDELSVKWQTNETYEMRMRTSEK